jgi:hypothetical protein
MPCEELRPALARAREGFRSALAATAEQVRGFLAAARGGDGSGDALGRFAAGRIDASRFDALFSRGRSADAAALAAAAAAQATLVEVAGLGDALFEAEAPPGASLRDVVAGALAEVGRAFGAARAFDLARGGRAAPPGPLPFDRWSHAERLLAPPLAVRVTGAGLRAEGLAEFLDGAQKIVLDVRGPCPLAPLVRLVTPGVFVLQTADGAGLDRFGAWEGPGVAAVVPEGVARFAHDPAAGSHPWERVTIGFLPEARAGAGRSRSEQAEERRQLEALAARPFAEPAPFAAPAGDPADRLAAWLLGLGEAR